MHFSGNAPHLLPWMWRNKGYPRAFARGYSCVPLLSSSGVVLDRRIRRILGEQGISHVPCAGDSQDAVSRLDAVSGTGNIGRKLYNPQCPEILVRNTDVKASCGKVSRRGCMGNGELSSKAPLQDVVLYESPPEQSCSGKVL